VLGARINTHTHKHNTNTHVTYETQVSGDGRVTVFDSRDGSTPYDLPLSEVLGDLPQKTFTDTTSAVAPLAPLALPEGATPAAALDRVLRLLQVPVVY
jgi:phosphoribosylformylglycinamidine synthase